MRAPAQPAKLGNALVADLERRELLRQHVGVELGVGARARDGADIDDQLDAAGAQQLDELGDASVGMADRVDWICFVRWHRGGLPRQSAGSSVSPAFWSKASMSGTGRPLISLLTVQTSRFSTSL